MFTIPLLNIRIGNTKASKIAKSKTIIGKFKRNMCLPFAEELHHRFKLAGIKSRVVMLSNEDDGDPRTAPGHAVVVYDDEGRTYAIDNETMSPKRLKHGADNQAVIKAWTGLNAVPPRTRIANIN